MIKVSRVPFLLLALVCLLTGLWAGLSRIGWDVFVSPAFAHHGAIMVGGFLGTLIAIEKIIPLKKRLFFCIPVTSAVSVLFFILNQPRLAILLLVLASIGLSVVFLIYFKRERTLTYALMTFGAVQWMIGNFMLLTKNFYPLAFPWWVGFILFVIVSERLELMKFLPVSQFKKKLLLLFLSLFVIGTLLSFHGLGNIIAGLSLLCIASWLMRNDLIGITLKKTGLPKFIAVALLSGYAALLITGMLLLTFSDQWLAYDALVHAFFIGFVFSMIFAHGPIIFPGILGSNVKPFHWALYVWLIILHGSWLLRIFGDAFVSLGTRKMSGVLSVASMVAYFVTIAVLTLRKPYKFADKNQITA